jgi:DNA-binding NarL/FixJ family response regulator
MSVILIVNRYPVVRQGLRQFILGDLPGSGVVEAQSHVEALATLEKRKCHAILLDLEPEDGVDLLVALRGTHADVPVLVLSAHVEGHFAARVLQAGAAGFLSSLATQQELGQAIRTIRRGGKYLSKALAEQIALGPVASLSPHQLSKREFEVLGGIAAGRKLVEIAQELSLSAKTVSSHKRRLMAKLGISRDAELMRYAIKHTAGDMRGAEWRPTQVCP